jgi:hypothetical protein
MENSARFGTSQLALADARLALGLLNHLRYEALGRVFGVSREQANALTVVMVLAAADGTFEVGRRLGRLRPHVSGADAALAGLAFREAGLSVAGPGLRQIPGLGTLVAIGMLGGIAAPSVRRTITRMRAAEERVRSERIRRYTEARERVARVAQR